MSRLQWQRRRILIWGKTRPELSQTYREIVCTGGVFADTRRLVRLYPIPLRYLDDEKDFKKYQWIEAEVARNLSDPRPESHKVRFEGIKTGAFVPTKTGNWDARAEWIMGPDHVFSSVEALQDRQAQDSTSLGLVQPARVSDIRAVQVSKQEKLEFMKRYEEAVKQMELPLDPETGKEIKPLRAADFRFKIHFRCADPRCQRDHQFSVLDWEMDALYFKLRTQQERSPQLAAQGVVDKLRECCSPEKELSLFLGNIFTHPQKFTIVGLWYPKRRSQKPQLELPLE